MDIHSLVFWLLSSSLMGGILAGIILLLRRIFTNTIGATWRYLLWFLLIAKLLMPFVPESSWSIYNFIQFGNIEEKLTQTFAFDKANKLNEDVLQTDTKTESPDYYSTIHKSFEAEYLFMLVWATVGLILATRTFRLNKKKKQLIAQGTEITNKRLLLLLKNCKEKLKIKKTIMLIRVSGLSVPMVTGTRKPQIILPEKVITNLSDQDLQYILLHELSHIRRGDLFVNWLLVLLQITHWFNPILWYAFYQMRQDRELACDAAVLSCLAPEEYKHYGAAIIAFLELNPKPMRYDMAAHFTNDIKHLKQRVTQIAWYKKPTFKKNIGIALLFSFIGCFVLTNATNAFRSEFSKLALSSGQTVVHEDLRQYFFPYDAAFVLYDIKNARYRIYNEAKSLKRVSPNSTYKIAGALIGLETGAIPSAQTVFPFQGRPSAIAEWNQNQTLPTALRYSVNWYFQTVDSAVGESNITGYLKQMKYGNCDLSGSLPDFWLENSLKISPLEQVDLLTKLYLNQLPISPENMETIKKSMILENSGHFTLAGKTGTGSVNDKNINGWFVGYVEKDGNGYIFAANIEGTDEADGTHAKNITLSILKDWDII